MSDIPLCERLRFEAYMWDQGQFPDKNLGTLLREAADVALDAEKHAERKDALAHQFKIAMELSERLRLAEAVCDAADGWRAWEWDNPTSGCDMSLDDIQATSARLQTGLRTALAAWRAATGAEGERK